MAAPAGAPAGAVEVVPLPALTIDGQAAHAHTQGLEVVAGTYYVTARQENARPKRALLLRTEADRQTWDVWDITPAVTDPSAGADALLDHPGGFQFGGGKLWIPLAQSRRRGRSLIRAYALADLRPGKPAQSVFEFPVDDHVGAIAVDTRRDLLWGANWDTETVYAWTLNGGQKRTVSGAELAALGLGIGAAPDGASGVAVQDWKIVGDGLMASGLRRVGGLQEPAIESWLVTLSGSLDPGKPARKLKLPVPEGVGLAREGMAVAGSFVYFLPEDLGATNRLYRMALPVGLEGAHIPQAGKPNVLILLADDLGYGDPGCFNPESKIATPHIDRLAREGMRFTDAHAPGPLCHPSRYGLMTGRYPFRTDVSAWPGKPLIEEGQVTVASFLRSQGYHTAMVGKWHLGFREAGYDQPLPGGPLACGFDRFFGMRASTDIPPYFFIRGDRAEAPPTERIAANRSDGWSPIQGAFWREGGIAPGLQLEQALPRWTEEAIEIIRSQAGAGSRGRPPFLLYLAYTAPHTPWLPSAAFAGKSGAGMYGDFTMMVDAEIGRVLAALDQADLTRETLVLFTSDNGPVWYEADVRRFGHDSAGGLRGMKGDAWEGGHRMPFIVRWPGRVKAGTVSQVTLCFTDLLATLADICGVRLPDGAGPDSISFLPALEGVQPADQPVRAPIVMQAGSRTSMMTIRSGDWKLISGLGSGGFSAPTSVRAGPGEPAGQLYNLRDDLAETKNLYLTRPDVVSRLEAEMQRILAAGRSR